MIVSLNQVETTIAKAALGAGWPHGLAEDCGRAAAWLAARGFDGVGAALVALESESDLPDVEETPDAWVFRAARAICIGPTAFDLLAAGDGPKRILLRAIDQPLLVIGFAGIAAGSYGSTYRLRIADDGQAIVDGAGVTISGRLPSSGVDISIERSAKKRKAEPLTVIDIEISDGLWRDAVAMALQSCVPSSTSSRQFGAGAGLSDDD